MRSSQRSKLAAVIVFALIAIVVVGGMAWATRSSFALARKNATDERDRKISRAVWEMSNYMAGIINSEAARGWDEYSRIQIKKVVAVLSEGNHEPDANWAVLPSPLATSDPPHKWIDLYFQLNQDGTLSSPQIADEAALWRVDDPHLLAPPRGADRPTWEWLRRVLPGIDLRERVARACTNDRVQYSRATGSGRTLAPRTAEADLVEGARPQASREYRQRQRILQDMLEGYVPPADCVPSDIATGNVRNGPDRPTADWYDGIAQLAGDVEISLDPITTFWLGPGPDGERKLAFVRECHADAAVFYQGFIGSWNRLKPELLAQITHLFPEADLQPVTANADPDPDAGDTQMINLPVRLSVADIPGGAFGAAWREIQGTLITSWLAAAAVLVVAGWGLRNLVALTERRMQFAYAVTHELRTPLTTFRLYSDMLSAGLVPDGSKQEYLDTLNRESIRLSSLVEDVLEYARLENHRVKLNANETSGTALLHLISETLDKRCDANGITAKTEDMLANGQSLRLDVDLVNRIAAVLVNNACRHARGTENATVLVRLCGDDGALHLDVIDSGPGVDRTDARTIFKPFRRGRGADAATQGGIGLGLALASSWATLLGGRLDLAARHHTQLGGAHFRLTIPTQSQQ